MQLTSFTLVLPHIISARRTFIPTKFYSPFRDYSSYSKPIMAIPCISERLASKVCIVTGASSGLGRAISLAFASQRSFPYYMFGPSP